MAPTPKTSLTLAILVAFVFAISSVSSSQQSTHRASRQPPATAQSVSEWVQHGQSLTRSKRAPWDWSLDALKCSLKIVSLQVSNYHDNQLMCCGLWWIKAYMKREAQAHCGETANRSISVFDEMINENLIYSDFAKSLIGDQTADCAAFPEGSPICDRFFSTITLVLILIVLTLITIIIGFIVAMVLCVKWRKAYLNEVGIKRGIKVDAAYKKANSVSELSDVSNTNNNNTKKTTQRLMNMIGNPFGSGAKKPSRTPAFNDDLLLKHDPKPPAPSQAANGGRITPLSDGRSSSASTNSTALQEPQKE